MFLVNRRGPLLIALVAFVAGAVACGAAESGNEDGEASQDSDFTAASAICGLKGKVNLPATHGEAPVPASERALLDKIITSSKQVVRDQAEKDGAGAPGKPFGRDIHTRGQACAHGTFKMADTIAPDLTEGVFQPGAEYRVVGRYSNGGSFRKTKDSQPTSRGFALKLVGLDPAKGVSQDFILHNSKIFFIRQLDHYEALLQSQRETASIFEKVTGPAKIFDKNECTAFLSIASLLKVDNLTKLTYFSGAPYKMKNTAVKYRAEPCGGAERNAGLHIGEDGYLRKAVAATLSESGACYDFSIQRQTADDYVEDPTLEWKGKFEKVGRIVFPKQDVTKADDLCEFAAFTPGNTWDEHRPVGQLGRVRREVYTASLEERQRLNIQHGILKAPFGEPTGKEPIFKE